MGASPHARTPPPGPVPGTAHSESKFYRYNGAQKSTTMAERRPPSPAGHNSFFSASLTMKHWTILALMAVMPSCAGSVYQIDSAARKFRELQPSLELGMSKGDVLTLVLPLNEKLDNSTSMAPEMYVDSQGRNIEIHFARSSRQADGLTTQDEFTPLVFTDNVLTAIGWASLGGPKTGGQARDSTTVIINP